MAPIFQAPSSVLIIGSGVFGLSTALALTQRPAFANTRLVVVDRSLASSSSSASQFTSRDASSIDSSRIVRYDYADTAYGALAARALALWRQPGPDSLGGQGRYQETGFIVAANNAPPRRVDGIKTGMGYAKESYANAIAFARAEGMRDGSVRELANPAEISRLMAEIAGKDIQAPLGDWAYYSPGAGWADAEKCVDWLFSKVKATGRVEFISGAVAQLDTKGSKVTGATLEDGRSVSADLVIAATGAWTGGLVDLRDQVVATGQALAYVNITDEEQEILGKLPVVMNMTTGLFIIPPHNKVLKVARHAYGYRNPTRLSKPLTTGPRPTGAHAEILTSYPKTFLDDKDLGITADGEAAARECLRTMCPLPAVHERPFSDTRICWYTDTATGDFLIDYHPNWEGLFVATGGSGHGFKFLPVIGDSIVDCVMGDCPVEFKDKWSWRHGDRIVQNILTEDGSRGGRTGMVLDQELATKSQPKAKL